MSDIPHLGVGLEYREPLHHDIMANADRIDFLEFISDQYLYGLPDQADTLGELLDTFPLIPHGIGMSIGTAQTLEPDYIRRLAALTERVAAPWYSDHLCVAAESDAESLWFTAENVAIVRRNLRTLARVIPRKFLLENISCHVHLPGSELTEAEFVREVLGGTDVGLLLDVRNVWVNSVSLGVDPYRFLDAIPLERTVQIHLTVRGEHGGAVTEPVWDLLRYALKRAPAKAILLAWDRDWPEVAALHDHLDRARELLNASRLATPC